MKSIGAAGAEHRQIHGDQQQSVYFALMDRVGRLVVTAVGQHTQIAEIVSSPLLVSAEGFLISA